MLSKLKAVSVPLTVLLKIFSEPFLVLLINCVSCDRQERTEKLVQRTRGIPEIP
jgi:hypothetical protein